MLEKLVQGMKKIRKIVSDGFKEYSDMQNTYNYGEAYHQYMMNQEFGRYL